MSSTPYDDRLWFLHKGCTGRHFILGNPHTTPGRMLGWCAADARSFFFSKNDMEEASPEASLWVAGYLAGSEPEPACNAEGDVDFDSPEYKDWLVKVEQFRETGAWPRRPEAEGDGDAQASPADKNA